MNKLDMLYLSAKSRICRFLEGEEGETNIIAIVVVLGIVVALAITFGDKLTKLFEAWWGQITTPSTILGPIGG